MLTITKIVPKQIKLLGEYLLLVHLFAMARQIGVRKWMVIIREIDRILNLFLFFFLVTEILNLLCIYIYFIIIL